MAVTKKIVLLLYLFFYLLQLPLCKSIELLLSISKIGLDCLPIIYCILLLLNTYRIQAVEPLTNYEEYKNHYVGLVLHYNVHKEIEIEIEIFYY